MDKMGKLIEDGECELRQVFKVDQVTHAHSEA